MRKARWLLVVVTALLALVACGGDDDSAADTGEGGDASLVVYAAASLTEVFPAIDPAPQVQLRRVGRARDTDPRRRARRTSRGSELQVSGDVNDEGLVEEPVTFASNRLVLIVPTDNPAGIEEVADVAEPGVSCDRGRGRARGRLHLGEVLESLDLTTALDNVVSNEDDVKGVVGKVSLGEADAGFVYATDAAVGG